MKFLVTACVTAWLALGTGCFWANARSDSMYGFEGRAVLGSNGHVEGAQAHVKAGKPTQPPNRRAHARWLLRVVAGALLAGPGSNGHTAIVAINVFAMSAVNVPMTSWTTVTASLASHAVTIGSAAARSAASMRNGPPR